MSTSSGMTVAEALRQAIALHQAGQLAQAEALYRRVLLAEPANATALNLLGVLAHQTGNPAAAIELMRRAITIVPAQAAFHSNLGEVLASEACLDDAVAWFHRAVELDPRLATAHYNLANVLSRQGRLDEAAAAYEAALSLAPDDVAAITNLAGVLKTLGGLERSIELYERAATLQPALPEAHFNVGAALAAVHRYDDAIAAYERALQLRPDDAAVLNNLGGVLHETGRIEQAIETYRRVLAVKPDYAEAHSNLIMAMHYAPGVDGPAILAEARRWEARHAVPLSRRASSHANSPDPDRRLRVGYISADFREHAAGWNVLPLIRGHDRGGFEILCYTNDRRVDRFTRAFRGYADHWREIFALDDDAAERLIRDDRIDILVDLSVHTAGHRLRLMSRRPAPVQMTFAGYPGTTGLSAIDYRISDPFLDPPDDPSRDAHYAERTLRLPHSFWCWDPAVLETAGLTDVARADALPPGEFTFGCLNGFRKINDHLLRVWARVLRGAPASQLLLLCDAGSHREHVIDVMRDAGAEGAASRIEFLPRVAREAYFRAYHRMHVALDPFPYNGHTTSLDAMWMGVPVVTMLGQTAVARAGWSQLSNVRLTELAARTEEEFVERAVELSLDPERLKSLRALCRERMVRSPLTNAKLFARDVEELYRWTWREWCGNTARERAR